MKTKKVKQFTDVQVRIHNTSNNEKKILEINHKDLLTYINKIRKQSTDSQGRLNWKNFSHLPLVSFVDIDEMEEIVLEEKDLPKGAVDIKTTKGTFLAIIK